MSPGKRATLPPADYRRPGNLSPDGLIVTSIGEDGEQLGQVDFRSTAGPEEVRRELIAAFARLCSSTGTWNRPATCEKHGNLLKRFLTFLGELDTPPVRVAEITPGMWSQWQVSGQSRGHGGRSMVRRVLVATGALSAATGTCQPRWDMSFRDSMSSAAVVC